MTDDPDESSQDSTASVHPSTEEIEDRPDERTPSRPVGSKFMGTAWRRVLPTILLVLLFPLALFYIGVVNWVTLPAIGASSPWYLLFTWFLAVQSFAMAVLIAFAGDPPGRRAIAYNLGMFLLSTSGVLGAFAQTYLVVASRDPDAFNQELDAVSAAYHAVGTFATTGAGSISAESDAARLVTVAQIGVDFVIVVILAGLVVSSIRITRGWPVALAEKLDKGLIAVEGVGRD